ncbi:hypothetical protein SerAS12_4809 [Serratia sp. AS12]|nr:hypothetical protein SerAS9_4808 [Serratia plymuthica AS9]AEF52853.1 hypothetical protein SerAS12_4809 [Serratia sp. AS12]AEG30560.1 hypothetical protein SerAS13_4809 [Serratia sp. AS13]
MFIFLLIFLTGLSIFSFWKHYKIMKERNFMRVNKKRALGISPKRGLR